MTVFPNELVSKIYSLPKTGVAVTEFLNSWYEEACPNGKVKKRQMWERFEASYVKITRHYVRGTNDDEADIYLLAHKLISRCVLAVVSPYFESDGQLFSYFQLMVRNTRINNSVKDQKESVILIDSGMCDDSDDSHQPSIYDFAVSVSTLTQPSTPELAQSMIGILEMIDEFDDPYLVAFGRLFINNSYSFDGIYGLLGVDLKRFKELKKKFIEEIYLNYSVDLKKSKN